MRFTMLETVREYAAEQLSAEDRAALPQRHLAYFTRLAEAVPFGRAQAAYLNRLGAEQDNLRAALEWALAHEAEAALRLAVGLGWFWLVRGQWREGREVLERALAQAPQAPPQRRGWAMGWAGTFAYHEIDFERGQGWLQQSLDLHRQESNLSGMAFALFHLGTVAHFQGHHATAHPLLSEALALARQQGDPALAADCLCRLGWVRRDQGDYEQARGCYEEGLALHRQGGHQHGEASALFYLGHLALVRGEHEEARRLMEQALEGFRDLGDLGSVVGALNRLAEIALATGNPEAARTLYTEGLALTRQIDSPRAMASWRLTTARIAAAIESENS
jgi:non-specific serine/threonine protein kinase